MKSKTDSSAYEVLSVILPTFVLILITSTSSTLLHDVIGRRISLRYSLEICLLVIPLIFNVTILVPFMKEAIAFYIFVCSNLIFFMTRYASRKGSVFSYKVESSTVKKDYVTNTRSAINMLTAIAILAVDFNIFPRQFRKKLKYGYSLMDVGVGLFVFANGIVASEVRVKSSFLKIVKDTTPLIVLGFGRYVATTVISYKVAETEYGVHWNFFITLAVTKLISSSILQCINIKYSIFTGSLLLCAHEYFLQTGLANYVFSNAKRDNFFSANREGIISSIGFTALYFLSVFIGTSLNIREKKNNSKLKLAVKLTIFTIILLSLTFYLKSYFNLSRRLANSAYCLWTLSIGVLMTTLLYISELFQNYIYKTYNYENCVYVPFIFEAISYNGLAYFLVSNVITGMVNMMFETLLISTLNSLLILIVYTSVTCIIIGFLYLKKIKLKL